MDDESSNLDGVIFVYNFRATKPFEDVYIDKIMRKYYSKSHPGSYRGTPSQIQKNWPLNARRQSRTKSIVYVCVVKDIIFGAISSDFKLITK